ncbi:MAG: sensor histidine kinase [Candidatus Accumulibacter sp.]|uniref:sensor histidine kinase n=1 Tax=Accumulibacter sp. TaxID=2053492 RepID=UPI001A5D6B46|nr:ATP-binding protein [Accumulibacter sp.]MBL8395370.1 sensor histidine kinase [Accumulibacter sp.]
MKRRLPSIRKRLTRALVVWSILWGVAVSAAVWLAVRQEVDELLDDTLQASAGVLSGPLTNQAGANQETGGQTPGPIAHSPAPSGRFAWQVVQYAPHGQARVVLSAPLAPASALRDTPSSGFADVPGWRVFGLPLANDSRMLYVAQSHEERREAQLDVAFSASMATLAIALLAHLWLRARARHELQPLERLAQRLATHDPVNASATLGSAERTELQPVHAAIDGLTERLAHRLAQERAFTAHAAHALRTPLAGIDAQLAVALRECPPQLQPRLQRVRTAAGRLQRVVTALLTLFRSASETRPQPLDLAALVARLPIEGLACEMADGLVVTADADLLAAALLNLFDNALRHGATRVHLSTPRANVLRVVDDGPGLNHERRARLQSALTTQTYEGQTGLGLMLTDLIARAHGGALLLPEVDQGFAAELHLAPEHAIT